MIDQADHVFLNCEPTSLERIGMFRIKYRNNNHIASRSVIIWIINDLVYTCMLSSHLDRRQ